MMLHGADEDGVPGSAWQSTPLVAHGAQHTSADLDFEDLLEMIAFETCPVESNLGAQDCWGQELKMLSPAFNLQSCCATQQGNKHFKSKFCFNCCSGHLLIPLMHVRALTLELKAVFPNPRMAGLWTTGHACGIPYRLINQTLKCSGPALIIFKSDASALPYAWAPIPEEWITAGSSLMTMTIAKGTIIPEKLLTGPGALRRSKLCCNEDVTRRSHAAVRKRPLVTDEHQALEDPFEESCKVVAKIPHWTRDDCPRAPLAAQSKAHADSSGCLALSLLDAHSNVPRATQRQFQWHTPVVLDEAEDQADRASAVLPSPPCSPAEHARRQPLWPKSLLSPHVAKPRLATRRMGLFTLHGLQPRHVTSGSSAHFSRQQAALSICSLAGPLLHSLFGEWDFVYALGSLPADSRLLTYLLSVYGSTLFVIVSFPECAAVEAGSRFTFVPVVVGGILRCFGVCLDYYHTQTHVNDACTCLHSGMAVSLFLLWLAATALGIRRRFDWAAARWVHTLEGTLLVLCTLGLRALGSPPSYPPGEMSFPVALTRGGLAVILGTFFLAPASRSQISLMAKNCGWNDVFVNAATIMPIQVPLDKFQSCPSSP